MTVITVDKDQEVDVPVIKKFLPQLLDKDESLLVMLINDHNDAVFPICQIWNEMASEAFCSGVDWVLLLGKDILYKAFLQLEKKRLIRFFGCPWWNDKTYPNFPTFFPVVL